jgi:hypothetical protein
MTEYTWTRQGEVLVTLNVKLFCCCSKAAKETIMIVAKANAMIALFSVKCTPAFA